MNTLMPRVLSANTLLVDLEVAASVAEMFEGHKLLAARLREHARRLREQHVRVWHHESDSTPADVRDVVDCINGGPIAC